MYMEYSVQFNQSVVSDSLWPHELQHTRPPCPSPTPGVHPNSCASSWWCHPAISSSVIPFSSCPQSLYGILFNHKKLNSAIYNKMDGSRWYDAWWNKSDREIKILYIFYYVWNLENKTNIPIQWKRNWHRNREWLVVTRRKKVGGRGQIGEED